MKKKILLIAAVILVSVSILSISKIVQEKYLNKDTASLQQNSGTVKEDNVKEDAKKEIEKEEVKQEVKQEDPKETTKIKVENETPKEQNSEVESKTAESTTVAKAENTEKVETVQEVPKEVATEAPVPKKQPNFIIKDDISGKVILSINLNNESKTVGDVTISQLASNNISYKASGRGETIYITMINNLKNRGVGPLSGWCYFVNGAKPGVSCGAYKLKSGDVVEWKYLEDGVNN
jgi:cytoskeletal protein RodZ